MEIKLRKVARELACVEAAIRRAPLLADPGRPRAGFHPLLIELTCRESVLVRLLRSRGYEPS